jgi:hypothetical protein
MIWASNRQEHLSAIFAPFISFETETGSAVLLNLSIKFSGSLPEEKLSSMSLRLL